MRHALSMFLLLSTGCAGLQLATDEPIGSSSTSTAPSSEEPGYPSELRIFVRGWRGGSTPMLRAHGRLRELAHIRSDGSARFVSARYEIAPATQHARFYITNGLVGGNLCLSDRDLLSVEAFCGDQPLEITQLDTGVGTCYYEARLHPACGTTARMAPR